VASPGIAHFLDQLEQRARREWEQHVGLRRWGLTGVGAIFGALAAASLFRIFSWERLPAVLAGIAGAALVSAAGFWLARRNAARLPRLRAQVRTNLLDHGLLQLALEHDPYDRLPSLQPLLPGLLSKRYTQAGGEPVTERLRRLVSNHESCCREAGLAPSGGPAATAGEMPRDRQLWLLGLVLLLGGIPLVPELERLLHINLFWLRFPLMIGGLRLMHLGNKTAPLSPLGQSSLLTCAVRLELAEMLRSGQATALPGGAEHGTGVLDASLSPRLQYPARSGRLREAAEPCVPGYHPVNGRPC
jgi:hypothetical protein